MCLVTDGSTLLASSGVVSMKMWASLEDMVPNIIDSSCVWTEMYRLMAAVLTWCSRNSVSLQEEARELVRSLEPRACSTALLYGMLLLFITFRNV